MVDTKGCDAQLILMMLNFILSKNVTRTVLKDEYRRTLRAPDRYLLGDLDATDGYSDATHTSSDEMWV